MKFHIHRRRFVIVTVIILGAIAVAAEIYFLSPSARAIVVEGAEKVGADEFLVDKLSDRDLEVRTSARDALVRRGPKAVPTLVAMLGDPEEENRRTAAAALAHIGPAAIDALPELQRVAIEDKEEEVLEAAGEALGRVARGHPQAVASLLTLLEAPSDATRLAAIRAAAYLDDRRAVPHLIASLKHTNPKVREEAAESLGKLLTLSIPAVPDLIELQNDPSDKVRTEARQALTLIIKAGHDSMDPDIGAKAKLALEKASVGKPASKSKMDK